MENSVSFPYLFMTTLQSQAVLKFVRQLLKIGFDPKNILQINGSSYLQGNVFSNVRCQLLLILYIYHRLLLLIATLTILFHVSTEIFFFL